MDPNMTYGAARLTVKMIEDAVAKDASGYYEGKVFIDQDDLEQFFKEIGEVCEKYSKKGEGDGKHGHTVGVIVAPPGEMS